MSGVLSAEEIAKLFEGAREGNLPDGAPERRVHSVHKIDFSRPMKLSLVAQRRFERAHEGFCRQAGDHLTGELRAPVELEVIDCSQITWQTALEDVPQPSILGVAACGPSEAIVVCVERGLVLRMIDRQLGGSFTDIPHPRELTDIDTLLARHAFAMLLGPLSATWQELLGLTLAFVGFDLQNTPLEFTSEIQPTLELTMEVRDECASSTILLLVPHTAIEAASRQLDRRDASSAGGHAEEDERADASIGGALRRAPVEVRAEAGATTMTIGEVLALGRGDIVPLGAAGDAGIVVGDSRLHDVRVGLCGNRRAVQVVGPTGGER